MQMRFPRFVHRLWAWLRGYFWIPCPICSREFGGHERKGGLLYLEHPLYTDGTSMLVCRNCGKEALARNKANYGRYYELRLPFPDEELNPEIT